MYRPRSQVDRRFHEEPQLSTFHTQHTSFYGRAEAASKVLTARLAPRRSDTGTCDTSFLWPTPSVEELAKPIGRGEDVQETLRSRTSQSNLMMRLGSTKSVTSNDSRSGGAGKATNADLPLWEPAMWDLADRKRHAPALGPDSNLLSLLPSGHAPVSMCFSGRATLHGSVAQPTGPPVWRLDEAFVANIKERLEKASAPAGLSHAASGHVGMEPGLASQLSAAVGGPGAMASQDGKVGIFAKARRRLSNLAPHGSAPSDAHTGSPATHHEGEFASLDPSHATELQRFKSYAGDGGGAPIPHHLTTGPRLNETNSMLNIPDLDTGGSSQGSPAGLGGFKAALAAAKAAGMQASPRVVPGAKAQSRRVSAPPRLVASFFV